MADEYRVVNINERGVIHYEGDKLVVGDLDIIKKARAMWGGNRQRGRVHVQFFLEAQESTDVSPDMNGTFAEGSEPAA